MTGAVTLSLHPDHLADLRKSGLADDMVRAAGLHSVRPCDLSRIIGFAPQGVTSALEFPYAGDGGFSRYKVFPPYRGKDGRTAKYLQKKGTGARLYIPPGCAAVLRDASVPLAVTEGEKKALRLTQEGTLSLGIGGLWNWFAQGEPIPDLDKVTWRGRPVTVYPDSDVWGRSDLRQAVFAFGKELEGRGATVSVAIIPGSGGDKVGIDDFLVGRGRSGVSPTNVLSCLASLPLDHPAFADAAAWWEQWRGNGSGGRESGQSAVISLLADVVPEKVTWLWRGYIPVGKLTIIEGDPGLGKSTASLDLAARVSTGTAMPDGTPTELGGVVVLSLEDGLADTIVPRLIAAGADLTRCISLDGIRENGKERLPTIEDIVAIRESCEAIGAKLVIIDPLMGFLSSKKNSWRDQDMRSALGPLAKLAEEMGVAVVLIRHLNKAAGGQAIYRGGGSIGISGAARAALLIAKDPEDSNRRVMACVKTNLAKDPPSLAYSIEAVGEHSRIVWGGFSALSADALLVAAGSPEEQTALGEAKDFLRELLAAGPVEAKAIQRQARGAGISDKTLHRAKNALGVLAKKEGFHSGWQWNLAEDGQEMPKVANINNDDHLRGNLTTFAREEVFIL